MDNSFKADNRDDLNYFINEINCYRDTIKHLDSLSLFFLKLYISFFIFIFGYAAFFFSNNIEKHITIFSLIGLLSILLTVLIGLAIMRLISHLSKKRVLTLRQIVSLRSFIDGEIHNSYFSPFSILPLEQENIVLKHFVGMPTIFNMLNVILPLGSYFYIDLFLKTFEPLKTYNYTSSISLCIASLISFVFLIALSNSCSIHSKERILATYATNNFSERDIIKEIDIQKKILNEADYLLNRRILFVIPFYSLFTISFSFAIMCIIWEKNDYILYSQVFLIVSLIFAVCSRFYFLKSYLKKVEKRIYNSFKKNEII